MLIEVELHLSELSEEEPHAFFIGSRRIIVLQIIDRWLAPQYSYFKIQGNDGATYILRHEKTPAVWEMTLFQAANSAL